VSDCLTVHLSIYPSIRLITCLSDCRPVCLYVCLSVHQSVCPSFCMFVCQLVCLSVCQLVCLSACLSVRMSACLHSLVYSCLSTSSGCAISNGSKPKSCFSTIFNFKLGSLTSKEHKCMSCKMPHLKLKPWPRFRPVSSSMDTPILRMPLGRSLNLL
jgi:hypothetical protein